MNKLLTSWKSATFLNKMSAETMLESLVSQALSSIITTNKSFSPLIGLEANSYSILMLALPSSAISPSSISSSLDQSALIVQTIPSFLMELVDSIVLRDITQLEKKFVLIVGKDTTGMELPVWKNALLDNSWTLLIMNVNVQQVSTGTELDVSVVLVEGSSTMIRTFVNVQKEQDGMDSAVLPYQSVKMEKNGMSLSLCVNVLSIVFGMEHTA